MCSEEPRPAWARRLMTRPRVLRDLFILMPSFSCSPTAPDVFWFSLPAHHRGFPRCVQQHLWCALVSHAKHASQAYKACTAFPAFGCAVMLWTMSHRQGPPTKGFKVTVCHGPFCTGSTLVVQVRLRIRAAVGCLCCRFLHESQCCETYTIPATACWMGRQSRFECKRFQLGCNT